MINIIGVIIFVLITVIITIILVPKIKIFIDDPLKFRDYINEHGVYGVAIFLLLQIIQIIVSIIPGEFIEVAAGISFGWFYGFVLCEIGIFIASSFIYFISRKLGKPIVESFIGKERFKKLEKFNHSKKRDQIIFLIFFIPALPKDLLTYVASFFDISYKKLMSIILIARIPSIITSTIAGNYIINKEYWKAILIFVITGAIAIVCYFLSDKIMKKIESIKHKKTN